MSQETTQIQKRLLIRPLRCECTKTRFCELCEAIERLGGVKSENGFAFQTARERAIAVEMLGENFGTRLFEVV